MFYLEPHAPDPTQPRHEVTVELEDVTFTYRLRWISRTEGWYLDLFDAAGARLLAGARLTTNWPAYHRHQLAGVPPGRLYLGDVSGAAAPATLASLGAQHRLVYLTAAEVAEAFPLLPGWGGPFTVAP